MRAYRAAVTVFALTFIGLGFTLLVVTAVRGGGVGLVIGALFVTLGAGRLYLLLMRK